MELRIEELEPRIAPSVIGNPGTSNNNPGNPGNNNTNNPGAEGNTGSNNPVPAGARPQPAGN